VVISNYGTGGDAKNRGLRYADQPAATVTEKVGRNKIERIDA
jgi:DNA (cytosine-5)-methyltransferase 1